MWIGDRAALTASVSTGSPPRQDADFSKPALTPGEDPILRFSVGDIGRKQAMRMLDVSYGELLDRVADRRLALPLMPREERHRMVTAMMRVLDESAE